MSSRRDFLSTAWAAAGAGAAVAGAAVLGRALAGAPDPVRTVELPAELLKRAEESGGLVHEGLLVRGWTVPDARRDAVADALGDTGGYTIGEGGKVVKRSIGFG